MAIVTGCALNRPPTDPTLDRAARDHAAAITALNQDIVSSRGSGRLKLETPGGTHTFRFAWAAQTPDRARMTFLSMGHPVETIAANGRQVTFVSHVGRHPPHTTLSADPDLTPYIDVPVRIPDLVRLLLGQVPVREFDDAFFIPVEGIRPGEPGRIRLRRNYHFDSQEITLSPSLGITVLRQLDHEDRCRYDIRFHDFDMIDGFRIPVRLTVSNGGDRRALITLTRFLPNAPIKESVFQLTGNGS